MEGDGPGRISGKLDGGPITVEVVAERRAEGAGSEELDGLVANIDAREAFANVHTAENPDSELVGRIVPRGR